MALYSSMQMVRSNENNNIIYSNSMKIAYWDEIYPDDKIYIRPEDGKKFSIVDGVCYVVHPIYTLFAASEYGIIINIKHGSPIGCNQHSVSTFIQCSVWNLGCSERLQRQVHRIVYECYNGVLPKGKIITHINGNVKDNRLCNLQFNTMKSNLTRKQDKLDMLYDN